MKAHVEYAVQYLDNDVWQPIRPTWTESRSVLMNKVGMMNKTDWAYNLKVKRRIVRRTVTEPEIVGEPFLSGEWDSMEGRMNKLLKGVGE